MPNTGVTAGQTAGANEQYADAGIDYTLFNSDKSLLRCTTDRIPNTAAAFKDSHVPYGIIVKPFGDLPAVSNTFSDSIND